MELSELVNKAKAAEQKAKNCNHLFQEYAQQLSDQPAYVCLHCGTRFTQQDRWDEERFSKEMPEYYKVSKYLPPEPLEGTIEWYQKHCPNK